MLRVSQTGNKNSHAMFNNERSAAYSIRDEGQQVCVFLHIIGQCLLDNVKRLSQPPTEHSVGVNARATAYLTLLNHFFTTVVMLPFERWRTSFWTCVT